MIDWILAKLKEPSTKAGLAGLVALVGLKVSPDVLNAAWTAILAAVMLYEVWRKEHKA